MEQENNVEQEIQTNPLEDLINHSLGQDYNKANQVFGDLMGQKVQDALDQEKIRVADTVFNGYEEPEEDIDDDIEASAEDDFEGEDGYEDQEIDDNYEENDEIADEEDPVEN